MAGIQAYVRSAPNTPGQRHKELSGKHQSRCREQAKGNVEKEAGEVARGVWDMGRTGTRTSNW
jgi:hypothetical protein